MGSFSPTLGVLYCLHHMLSYFLSFRIMTYFGGGPKVSKGQVRIAQQYAWEKTKQDSIVVSDGPRG